jgi:hypothetical protein
MGLMAACQPASQTNREDASPLQGSKQTVRRKLKGEFFTSSQEVKGRSRLQGGAQLGFG